MCADWGCLLQSLVESAVTKLELVLHTAAATPDEGSPGSPGGERPGMSAHELYGLCHGACQMVQHATPPPSPPHSLLLFPLSGVLSRISDLFPMCHALCGVPYLAHGVPMLIGCRLAFATRWCARCASSGATITPLPLSRYTYITPTDSPSLPVSLTHPHAT